MKESPTLELTREMEVKLSSRNAGGAGKLPACRDDSINNMEDPPKFQVRGLRLNLRRVFMLQQFYLGQGGGTTLCGVGGSSWTFHFFKRRHKTPL